LWAVVTTTSQIDGKTATEEVKEFTGVTKEEVKEAVEKYNSSISIE